MQSSTVMMSYLLLPKGQLTKKALNLRYKVQLISTMPMVMVTKSLLSPIGEGIAATRKRK